MTEDTSASDAVEEPKDDAVSTDEATKAAPKKKPAARKPRAKKAAEPEAPEETTEPVATEPAEPVASTTPEEDEEAAAAAREIAAAGGTVATTESNDETEDGRLGRGGRGRGNRNREMALTGEEAPVAGVLEIHDKGYGFLRKPEEGCQPTSHDVFVPPDAIKRYGLREGLEITGLCGTNGRGPQLVRMDTVDGKPLDDFKPYVPFEDLTVINPNRLIKMETVAENLSTRVIDFMTPIGHGQRALIVAPPRSGKTVLLQNMANAVAENHPDTFLIIVLIDERPEEVTEFRAALEGKGELWASSNDMELASHVRMSKLVIERARRLVESGRDVFMLLDSITRLARAHNNAMKGGGKTGSGGLDTRAMEIPRKFFASARQTEEAGALTIVGTALIDTGSRMDEVIFQEFKGTGNSEIVLDRKLADMRIYPAIDIAKSGTRREELLLSPETLDKVGTIRRGLHGTPPTSQMERLKMLLHKYPDNATAVRELPSMPAR